MLDIASQDLLRYRRMKVFRVTQQAVLQAVFHDAQSKFS